MQFLRASPAGRGKDQACADARERQNCAAFAGRRGLRSTIVEIGFGLTPFQSGSLTCAAALGALTMKFSAARILKRFVAEVMPAFR